MAIEPTVATPADLKPASLKARFDLGDEALYQANYRFTKQEQEVMDDLKIELSRDLDGGISKNDLLRLGLHMLIENYLNNGEKSHLVEKLRKKTSK